MAVDPTHANHSRKHISNISTGISDNLALPQPVSLSKKKPIHPNIHIIHFVIDSNSNTGWNNMIKLRGNNEKENHEISIESIYVYLIE